MVLPLLAEKDSVICCVICFGFAAISEVKTFGHRWVLQTWCQLEGQGVDPLQDHHHLALAGPGSWICWILGKPLKVCRRKRRRWTELRRGPKGHWPRRGYCLQNDFHSRLPMALQSGGNHFGRLSTKNLSWTTRSHSHLYGTYGCLGGHSKSVPLLLPGQTGLVPTAHELGCGNLWA